MNPGNWLCKDAWGQTIPDVLPDAQSVVSMDRNGAWTSWPTFFTSDSVIDLKGHKLTVPTLGDATITDSSSAVYQLLDSIESTGEQYIDTLFRPGCRTVTTLEAIPTDVNLKCAFFGRWLEGSGKEGFAYGMYLNGNKKPAAAFNATVGDWKTNSKTPVANKTYKMRLDGANHTSRYWKDGVLDDTLSHAAVTSGRSTDSMFVFALHRDNVVDYYSKIKFLSMQVEEDGVLMRAFVPARRISNGEVGLLDLEHFGAKATAAEPEFYVNMCADADFIPGGATDVIGTAPGELHVNVASGETVVKSAVRLAGGVTLVKDGEGTLTWGGGTVAATCPILITNGVFKMGVTTADVFGNTGTITVKGKGQYDLNSDLNRDIVSPTFYRTFLIEGDGPDGTGAIVNTASGTSSGQHLKTVILTGDATIGGSHRIDFRARTIACMLNGEGHVLTIKNTGTVAFCEGYSGCKVDRIVVDGGFLNPYRGGRRFP